MSMIPLILAAMLCVYAAATDVKRLEIDNWVSAAIVALFVVYALMTPVLWPVHVVVMVVMLLAGLALHKAGAMGGGDIKILVALSLWAGLTHLPVLLMATSLAGALVALCTLWLHKNPNSFLRNTTKLAWVDSARTDTPRVAYGVAIALGACCMFTEIARGL